MKEINNKIIRIELSIKFIHKNNNNITKIYNGEREGEKKVYHKKNNIIIISFAIKYTHTLVNVCIF